MSEGGSPNGGVVSNGRTMLSLRVWRNTLTEIGAVTAGFSLLFLLSFLFFDLLSHEPNPYVGLFTYLILPGVLIAGLAVLFLGMVLARRRFKRQGLEGKLEYVPHIDFTNPLHRKVLAYGFGAVAISLPVIGVLSYRGYHYTDSNEFCGRVCHEVMEPQYTAFQQSPHANVGCAECHIGRGASWYVKAKLSGVRQVLAVAMDSFPRPIPPAIKDLRPATDTCHRCHWPARFYGDQLVSRDHFASDELNTGRHVRMLMKTGGSDPSSGVPSGIHWHMALGFNIEYVAQDSLLQDITWVKMVDHTTGKERVYRSDGLPGREPPAGIRRTVDCMDCHNRPTHIFRSPDEAANQALNANPSLQSLPFAKRELVASLVKPFETKEQAINSISSDLTAFYSEKYPQLSTSRSADIHRLIEVGSNIYSTNFFPRMNASWKTYPNNIGHLNFPGCFRCHEGKHIDESGKSITRECNACHEFLTTATEKNPIVQLSGFVHPWPWKALHATVRCDKCHTGGATPETSCAGCHQKVSAFRAGTSPAFVSFKISADPMLAQVDCEGCHAVDKPKSIESIDANCMDCHEDEEDKYKGMLASWKSEVDGALKRVGEKLSDQQKQLLGELKSAGPLHNIEATRKILSELEGRAATSAP